MMPWSPDERDKVNKLFRRMLIDAAQGLNYCEDYKDNEGIENFSKAVNSLQEIIKIIKS